ncbi:hypothetical protein FRX31_021344 [Thalictrum thalictroides]|uniref:Uncharacterized protein n=1 Tax=Thalictrum thalictroides TaxID=46969 RepID=A0A7J6VWU5_THATH|nr:hypothetical protein FRX31_021344 [Thalictrum thalictroides]
MVKILRLSAGRARNGWADVGLCLLDLFMPGVRNGKEVGFEEDNNHFHPKGRQQVMKLSSNTKETEKYQNGESKQIKQLTVGIGGVFN